MSVWARRMVLASVLFMVAWQALPIGWISPLVVQDVSMAPTLLGQHAVASCPRCGARYPIEWLPDLSPETRSTCAGCGRLHALGTDVILRGGDRVWIDRLARWSGPRRQQFWAFRDPADARRWLVKRIVGLPGERIDLRHGDLLVNGQVQAKSLDELREVSIPVMSIRAEDEGKSDIAGASADAAADSSATAIAALCWRPTAGSRWEARGREWIVPCTADHAAANVARQSAPNASTEGWQWLEFSGTEVSGRQGSAGLLLDDYSFHQSVSRSLHPMSDLWLSLELKPGNAADDWGPLAIAVEWSDAWQSSRAEWDWVQGEVRLGDAFDQEGYGTAEIPTGVASDRQTLAGHDGPPDRRRRLVFAAWDGQTAATWEERGEMRVLQRRLSGERKGPPQLRQLRIGVRGAGCRVRAIELRRDLYYYDARREAAGDRGQAGVPLSLGPGQFFVLGDNGPQSIDSRDQGPVGLEQLIGRVRKSR